MRPRRHGPAPQRAGFTLIEVVLAIVIALGLLSGVLLFYRQATTVRAEILRQTDRLSAARLVLERVSSELRTLPAGAGDGVRLLQGDSQSIRLLRAAVPNRSAWRGGALGRAAVAEADLVEVGYRLSGDTNSPGILREEHAFTRHAQVSTNLVADPDPSGTNLLASPPLAPLTEAIQYLRFRYWNGSRWLDGWDQAQPPLGVEVTLGFEPQPEEDFVAGNAAENLPPPEYPFEVFRRVVAVPTALGRPGARNPDDPVAPEDGTP